MKFRINFVNMEDGEIRQIDTELKRESNLKRRILTLLKNKKCFHDITDAWLIEVSNPDISCEPDILQTTVGNLKTIKIKKCKVKLGKCDTIEISGNCENWEKVVEWIQKFLNELGSKCGEKYKFGVKFIYKIVKNDNGEEVGLHIINAYDFFDNLFDALKVQFCVD